MGTHTWRRRVAIIAPITAAAALTVTVSAQAIQEIGNEMPNDFGYVSLTHGETAALSVANTGSEPCEVTLGFFDMNGVAYGGVDMRPVEIQPGTGTAIQLDWRQFGVVAPGDRAAFRPQVDVTAVEGRSGDGCETVPALQVFDQASGNTSFVLPGVLVGFNPQPDPPGQPGPDERRGR